MERELSYKTIIDNLTIEEKVSLLSGRDIWSTKTVDRLGIQCIYLSDGPNGIRKQTGKADHLGLNASLPATCFPSASALANSWDEELEEEVGEALGREARSFNVNVLLGPGLNVKRNPLCGRNFEYFSEDPYLSGKMAAAYIRGVQKAGAAACPKHFAVNSQENWRMVNNSVVDERTLREIYLTGFEIVVKEGKPKCIMTSYNKINGVYANENKHLLQDILRDEWKFDGAVVTDWGGSNSHTAGVEAGSSLEMPGTAGDSDRELLKAVRENRISERVIDERVDEILSLVLNAEHGTEKFHVEEHHDIARRAAERSIVMLKNDDGILPLKPETAVGIVGEFAEHPRYQGAGSSRINPTKVDVPLEIIKEFPINVSGYAKGYSRNGNVAAELVEEACALAAKSEVVLVYMGIPESGESEGMDREHMRLPRGQAVLLEELARINRNIVVILSAGGMVEMPWDKYCKGLLHCGLGGQAQAGAVLRVITGKVNPSGKLSETCPYIYEDSPAAKYWHRDIYTSEYREGLYVGYRYYETAEKPVKYPFGYGLSYTKFEYSRLAVNKDGVSFTVTNTGGVDGFETAQLYVGNSGETVFSPSKELKGFKKVYLKAGEKARIKIAFDDKTFRYFDSVSGGWKTQQGIWKIMVGASVADIRLEGELNVDGNGAGICVNSEPEIAYDRTKFASYYSGNVTDVPDGEFEALLGNIPRGERRDKGGKLKSDDPICEMYRAKSIAARLVFKIIKICKDRGGKKDPPDLNILFIYNLPFRGIAKMMNGMVSMEMTDAVLTIVNGRFLRGMKALIIGAVKNRKRIKKYYEGGSYEEK